MKFNAEPNLSQELRTDNLTATCAGAGNQYIWGNVQMFHGSDNAE